MVNEAYAVRGRTYAAIMEMAVENPLLSPANIAALLGRNEQIVRHVMRSDMFLEERAKLILERYGEKIKGMRAKLLDTASLAIDAINRKILDPDADAPAGAVLEAAEFLMKFVMAPEQPAQPTDPGKSGNVFVSINLDEVHEARRLQAQRASSIQLPPHPATPRLVKASSD